MDHTNGSSTAASQPASLLPDYEFGAIRQSDDLLLRRR